MDEKSRIEEARQTIERAEALLAAPPDLSTAPTDNDDDDDVRSDRVAGNDLISQVRDLLQAILNDPTADRVDHWLLVARLGLLTARAGLMFTAEGVIRDLRAEWPMYRDQERLQGVLAAFDQYQNRRTKADDPPRVGGDWWRIAPALPIELVREGNRDPRRRAEFRAFYLERHSNPGRIAMCYEYGWGTCEDDEEAHRWYLIAANEQTHPPSMYQLGNLHRDGFGVPKDLRKAAEWYRRATRHGHRGAAAELGLLHLHGLGVERSYAEAMRWLRMASDGGDERAMFNLGQAFADGDPPTTPPDDVAAATWFREAARAGHVPAMTNYGTRCLRGLGVPENPDEAVRWYEQAAHYDDALAMFNLARMHLDGVGIRADRPRGMFWLRRAAGTGDLGALDMTATLFAAGEFPPHESEELLRTMRRTLASDPFHSACLTLAIMYDIGAGVDADPEQAAQHFTWAIERCQLASQLYLQAERFERFSTHERKDEIVYGWYRRAAEAGIQNAWFDVGYALLFGVGTTENHAEAHACLVQSAERVGDRRAMFYLGEMHRLGQHVPIDMTEAVFWYRKAAMLGDANAMFLLAMMHMDGLGVPEDDAIATEWIRRAAELGHEESKIVLRDLEGASDA